MKKQWVLGLLGLVGLLALFPSCSTTHYENKYAVPNVPETPLNAVAGKNQSELVISTPLNIMGNLYSIYFYIDGEIAGRIKGTAPVFTPGGGGPVKLIIPNGEHVLSGTLVDAKIAPVTITAKSKRYNITIVQKRGAGLALELSSESELPLNPDGSNATGVEGALARAAEQTLKNVPAKSRIAIVYITAQDRGTTEYIVGELEYIWVNEGYFITDRSQLDQLRREQNFGMSGEVDDKTAAAIGKIAGASIIVTGRVDGEGTLRRLRLRALDTQTAQVVGVASERL